MPKVITIIAAAGIVAGGSWFGERMQLFTANNLVQSAQEAAQMTGIWSPPAGLAANAGELPQGAHLIEIYANARTIKELGEANERLRAELKVVQRVAASVSDTHSAATRSCTVAERQAVGAPTMLNEQSRDILDALTEIDAWMLHVVDFIKNARPEEAGTATLRYREFGVSRVDFEQAMNNMKSLLATFPRLAEACKLILPPLRAERTS